MKLFVALFALILFTSCAVQKGYIKFDDQIEDEIIPSQAIKEHLKANPNSSIVLKAPNSVEKVTESDDNTGIYNAIEKELLLAGFDVKDRGLFNEVINKSGNIDYAEIKKLTGTNLILELVQMEPSLEYRTNVFYGVNGNEIVEPGMEFLKYGAVVEFKITIIDGNKHGGSYLFHYAPCTEISNDCDCEVIYKAMPQTVYLNRSFCREPSSASKGYVSMPNDMMSRYVREWVKILVKEIRD